MSLPRRLVPGQIHFTTRRASKRCAFLLPTPKVKAIVLYTLGRAQQTSPGVKVHALCLEVTHKHDAVTDAKGESLLPAFYREFHALTARALNAHYGRGENLWRTESYDNVETHTPHDLEEQLLYIWTQPVKDGLVARPEDWPGMLFLPEDFGKTFTVRKPENAFFGSRKPKGLEPTYPPALKAHRAALRREAKREREERARRDRLRGRGARRRRQLEVERSRRQRKKERATSTPRDRDTLPEVLTVTISPPPGYEHMSLEEVRAYFRKLLDERVRVIHAEREAHGWTSFMGLERVMAQNPLDSVGDTFPSFARNPRIACKNPALRIALLQGLQLWRSAYQAALARWREDDRKVRFPWGAYWFPTFHGAETDDPPRAPPIAA